MNAQAIMDAWEREHGPEMLVSHIKVGHHADMIRMAGEEIGRALEADERRRWWESSDHNRERMLRAHDDFERATNALRERALGWAEQAYLMGFERGRGGAAPAESSSAHMQPRPDLGTADVEAKS